MSGGVEETFELNRVKQARKEDDEFWRILLQARKKKSVICCNVESDEDTKELELPNGLVKGHAYVVTTLVSFSLDGKQIRLLKCHNPWGTDIEYNGDWSKRSSTWDKVSKAQKKNLLNEVKKKGQFW